MTVQPVQWNVKNVIHTSDRTADSGIITCGLRVHAQVNTIFESKVKTLLFSKYKNHLASCDQLVMNKKILLKYTRNAISTIFIA